MPLIQLKADAVIGHPHAGRGELALQDQVLEIALEVGGGERVRRPVGILGEIPHRGEVARVGPRGKPLHLHGRDRALA